MAWYVRTELGMLLLLTYWKYAALAALGLALASLLGVMEVKLVAARHKATSLQAQLDAEHLATAVAVANATSAVLQTQDRAAILVQTSAKVFDAKLTQIRTSYAAHTAPWVHCAKAPASGGGNPVPEAASTTGQPDGPSPYDRIDYATIIERCSETTQQVISLQDYITGLRAVYP